LTEADAAEVDSIVDSTAEEEEDLEIEETDMVAAVVEEIVARSLTSELDLAIGLAQTPHAATQTLPGETIATSATPTSHLTVKTAAAWELVPTPVVDSAEEEEGLETAVIDAAAGIDLEATADSEVAIVEEIATALETIKAMTLEAVHEEAVSVVVVVTTADLEVAPCVEIVEELEQVVAVAVEVTDIGHTNAQLDEATQARTEALK